ncbi:MAG: hypothetical protein M1438_13590 [Deltaproteobacteria bacterium]|nr:hypothetical protein [Deltaproteobacteria bacterium]
MLQEEQAAELLNRCEKLLGYELRKLRGDLQKAGSRAAAVWELLVIEATSIIGQIKYEPLKGPSPDILLSLPNGRSIWIEVAYLYPRFWREERKSDKVISWIYSEARNRGIGFGKISIRLDGIDENGAGPVRKLPELHEREKFLNDPEVKAAFDIITSNPKDSYVFSLSKYTVSIFYNPDNQGPYTGWSGLSQEVPKTYKQHVVYRVLNKKAKQFDINGPLVVCLGSDQNRVINIAPGPTQISIRDAAKEAFYKNHSLSAVILVSINANVGIFEQFKKVARTTILLNPYATNPLDSHEIGLLKELNFNRWKYYFVKEKWEIPEKKESRRVTGSLKLSASTVSFKIEIPANIVIDALAGKTSLAAAYRLDKNKSHEKRLIDIFEQGWIVRSCSLKEGNIESGEAPKILFELLPPPLPVFWPKSKS